MDIFQRKVVLEDAVEYKFFLVQADSLSSKRIEERLKILVEEILAKVAPLLIQYIWQHQPFNLKYHPERGTTSSSHYLSTHDIGPHGYHLYSLLMTGDVPAHIGGSTQFGDNVEDEWFIVYLVQQITEKFPDVAAR